MLTKGLLIARGRRVETAVNGNGPTPVPFGPLACLPVANRPLIEHALDSLLAMGITEAVVAVEADAVDGTRPILDRLLLDSGVTASVRELPEGAGLPDAIATATPLLEGEPFVLHLGESLCWDTHDAFAATDLGADEVITLIGDSNESPDTPPDGLDSHAHVSGKSRFGHLGIYAVGAGFVQVLAATDPGRSIAGHARAAINRVADSGGQVHHWRKPGAWQYSHGAASLLHANRLALERLEPARIPSQVRECDIDGPVVIDPTAVVEASMLRGPLVIGPKARIAESYVGPFTSVDHDVVIEGAEVENSIVLGAASVRHVGSRLEGSIIGPEAKVFRDFRLPRAVRLDVGPGAQISLG